MHNIWYTNNWTKILLKQCLRKCFKKCVTNSRTRHLLDFYKPNEGMCEPSHCYKARMNPSDMNRLHLRNLSQSSYKTSYPSKICSTLSTLWISKQYLHKSSSTSLNNLSFFLTEQCPVTVYEDGYLFMKA